MNHEWSHTAGRRIFWGLILMVLGVFFLLNNFDVIAVGSIGKHWPLFLILPGAAKLLWPEPQEEPGSGLWLFFIGLWCYISTLHVAGLSFGTSLPVLLIAIGIKSIWKSSQRIPSAT